MNSLGFNINKGRLCHCLIAGDKKSASFVSKGIEKFDSDQPLSQLSNYFNQAFREVISRENVNVIAYRMSLDAVKASIPYLHFSFGILNLIAYDLGLPIVQTISNTFSSKALGMKGDKFEVCDKIISNIPTEKWNNDFRYAALAAWIALDG